MKVPTDMSGAVVYTDARPIGDRARRPVRSRKLPIDRFRLIES